MRKVSSVTLALAAATLSLAACRIQEAPPEGIVHPSPDVDTAATGCTLVAASQRDKDSGPTGMPRLTPARYEELLENFRASDFDDVSVNGVMFVGEQQDWAKLTPRGGSASYLRETVKVAGYYEGLREACAKHGIKLLPLSELQGGGGK